MDATGHVLTLVLLNHARLGVHKAASPLFPMQRQLGAIFPEAASWQHVASLQLHLHVSQCCYALRVQTHSRQYNEFPYPSTVSTVDHYGPLSIMAKKPVSSSAAAKTSTPVAASKPPPATRTASGTVSTPSTTAAKPTAQSSLSPRSSPQEILVHVWNRYLQDTPSRTMLLDVFMAWLVVVGGIQFVYCVIAGNYVWIRHPFHIYLGADM